MIVVDVFAYDTSWLPDLQPLINLGEVQNEPVHRQLYLA